MPANSTGIAGIAFAAWLRLALALTALTGILAIPSEAQVPSERLGLAASRATDKLIPPPAASSTATAAEPIASLSLLFPFVTNQNGDDTRLILDNLSGDAPGATAKAGACTVSFRGSTAGGGAPPPDLVTAFVPAGGQLDLTLSSIAPDFAGYVLAVCDFPAAVGKAIVESGAGRAFYEGDAEVLGINGAPLPLQLRPLLFAYATNAAGYDTRIVLANTTQDSLGTPAQSGACRIDYFGQNAPPSQQSNPLAAGGMLDFTLSQGAPAQGVAGAPAFAGYLTAACEFARARGFAAITQYQDPGLPAGASPAIAGFGLTPEILDIPIVITPIEPDPNAPPQASALLVSHASTRGPHETWLALANTSLDLLGTVPEPGACTIGYHGDPGSPAAAPRTLNLAAGETAVFPLSLGDPGRAIAGAPSFRGRLSISCDFGRARAVTLVTSRSASQVEAAFAQAAELLNVPRNAAPAPLLHSYVSNRDAEDRVVVLTNSSIDAFGTGPTNGACVLTYRGNSPPAPAVVPLPAGATRSFLLSRGMPALGLPGAPGFQGYLAGACDVGLVRPVDYRLNAAALAPFCDVDSTSGVHPADVISLANRLGEAVPLGDPADPDGDSLITDADIQYCNTIVAPVAPPAANPTGADLRIEIETSPTVARPQKALQFHVRIVNAGPEAAGAAVAAVEMPFAFQLHRKPPECRRGGQSFVCDLGSLAANRRVMLTFSGAVHANAASALGAFAQVSSSTADPDPANNTLSHVVPLHTQADLATGAYILPKGGNDAILTVSAGNRGPSRAENIRLRAQLPTGFALVETPTGCTLANQTLACAIEGLNPGRTKAYLLAVRRLPLAQGPFVATVSVSSSTSDHKPANNTATLAFPGSKK